MPRKKKRTNPTPYVVGICILGVAGFAWYVRNGPEEMKKPEDSAPIMTPQPEPETAPKTVQVPVPKNESGKVVFEMQERPTTSGEDPVKMAVSDFLRTTNIASDARVLSVKYDGDNLILDTTKLFDRGYGTDDEHTLFDGIVRAVAGNSKVKTLTFLSDGKPVDALGNIEIDGPIKVREIK